jgi:hypothetical protein
MEGIVGIALVVIVLMAIVKSRKRPPQIAPEIKICPFCAEHIRYAAKICKYCHQSV